MEDGRGPLTLLKVQLYPMRKISIPSGSLFLLIPVLVAAVKSIEFLRGQGEKQLKKKKERKKLKQKTLGISAPLLNIASSLSHASSQI